MLSFSSACECDLLGSGSDIINPTTTCNIAGGQCGECQPGVTGRLCDTCLNGWFNFSLGECQGNSINNYLLHIYKYFCYSSSIECGCNSEGSVSPVCDIQSGQCVCQPGVSGRTCDQCLPGYFNLTSAGCTACQCSAIAISEQCSADGQCECPDGVVGLTCDQCEVGFYNISIDGCLECSCDPLGSTPDPCDVSSGQCICTGGSVGLDCSLCPDRFFVTDSLIRERCVRCVCSGRSEICTVDENNFALGAVQSNFSEMCASNPSNCDDGWQLLTASGLTAAPYGPRSVIDLAI